MAPKKFRGKEGQQSMDPFAQLPIEIIQTIQSFFTTTIETDIGSISPTRFLDTKEATRTTILSKTFLQAWSTIPDLNFTDKAFIKLANTHSQEASKAREMFANYVHHTLTRYQQHNLPIRSLRIDTRVHDEKIANILEQCILKAKESDVKEVYIYLDMVINPQAPYNNLLETVFALKQLVSLNVFGCDLVKNDVQDYKIIINCSSLRKLELKWAKINEEFLQNLIRSCPLIEAMHLLYCLGPEKIQVANLPSLKRLSVFPVYNQVVDVKAASLEHMTYRQYEYDVSPYLLNIDSTQNLKTLILKSSITDKDFQNLIVKCPVLEEVLEHCYEIEKINVSSHLLRSLSLMYCGGLMEVKIDAPNLNQFEYVGNTVPSSLSFASGGSEKRKSSVTLYLVDLEDASSFPHFPVLREFLMMFKRSDNISLFIESEEISFDKNIIDDLNDEHNIPVFEEVYIGVSSPSSTYSTLMEGLLWSFSPMILTVKFHSKEDDGFMEYLCKELLIEHYPNSSTSSDIKGWRNYFKHAKIEGRDDEWHPLHSWKYLTDALPNLGDDYILKLSHP